MPRLKITTRANFYSGNDWQNRVKGKIVTKSDYVIVRDTTKYEIDNIVFQMNQNHYHPKGEFYCSPANPNDHDYVNYYVIYRNPIAP